MEHIEQAGIHSGDSSCVVPPFKLIDRHVATIRDYTRRIARALNVVGLMNAQFAIKDDMVYVLEVNPRASRTVPYLSKATGVPLAKVAARVMIGRTLAELGLTEDLEVSGFFVKTPVFPFVRFPGVDTLLGPEMKSTGEVMGGAETFGYGVREGADGRAGSSCRTRARRSSASTTTTSRPSCRSRASCATLGFKLVATRGTATYLRAHGLDVGDRLQGQRGPAARRRRDPEQPHPAGHQHAARPRVVLRRPHGAPGRDAAGRAVDHDAHRRGRDRQRHQGASHRRPHASARCRSTTRKLPPGRRRRVVGMAPRRTSRNAGL